VQLWVPEDEESEEFISAGTFLSIYDKVAGIIDVDPDAESGSSMAMRISSLPVAADDRLLGRLCFPSGRYSV